MLTAKLAANLNVQLSCGTYYCSSTTELYTEVGRSTALTVPWMVEIVKSLLESGASVNWTKGATKSQRPTGVSICIAINRICNLSSSQGARNCDRCCLLAANYRIEPSSSTRRGGGISDG